MSELLTLEAITPEEESDLIAIVQSELSKIPAVGFPGYVGRSRVLRYGYDYDKEQAWLCELPAWLQTLSVQLAPYNSVTINEYKKGNSIPRHIDSLDFGDPIQVLSLNSNAAMQLSGRMSGSDDGYFLQFEVPRRALVTLTGDNRYRYHHSILPVPELRYSIVFRRRLVK